MFVFGLVVGVDGAGVVGGVGVGVVGVGRVVGGGGAFK